MPSVNLAHATHENDGRTSSASSIASTEDDQDGLIFSAAEEVASSPLSSLPYELIVLVLDFAAPPSLSSGVDVNLHPRQVWLCATALTARLFVEPAQELLFHSLSLRSSKQASKWLASPLLGVYATRELDITGVHSGAGLSGTQATRVLQKVRGVQWLRIADFKRLSCRIFGMDSLRGRRFVASLLARSPAHAAFYSPAGLRALVLRTSFPDKSPLPLPSVLPFNLTTLHLYHRPSDPLILAHLLSASNSHLTDLHLALPPNSPGYVSIHSTWQSHVARSLKRLTLAHKPPDALVPLLAGCHALEELNCVAAVDVPALLRHLPDGRLGRLVLEVDYNALEVINALDSHLFVAPSLTNTTTNMTTAMSGYRPHARARAPATRRMTGPLSALRHLVIRGVTESELQMLGQRSFIEACWEARFAGPGSNEDEDEDEGEDEGGRGSRITTRLVLELPDGERSEAERVRRLFVD